jgi:hypothetical protein
LEVWLCKEEEGRMAMKVMWEGRNRKEEALRMVKKRGREIVGKMRKGQDGKDDRK